MSRIDPNPDVVLTLAEHEQRLEAGWQFLERYPNRRDAGTRFDLWVRWLRAYERHYTALQRGTVPHIQEAMFEGEAPRQAEWAAL